MNSIDKEIEKIRKEIRETPYNKSTEQHIGRLKAKLARLKEEKIKKAEKQAGGKGYSIKKSGDATVILAGFPSVGKSTLLNSLTGAKSEVAGYDFTTLDVIPGTLKYRGANIQILDVPGMITGASEGKGKGREVLSVLRNGDMLLLMIDSSDLEQYERIKEELYNAGIRLNEEPPNVKIQKRESGGLEISTTVDLDLSEAEVRSILEENGIINAEVIIREDLTTDRMIDAVMKNREYLPGLVLVNKVDLVEEDRFDEIRKYGEERVDEEVLYISAKSGELEALNEKMFEILNFIRVYLKPRKGPPDMEEPMILQKGAIVDDLCRRIHRDFESGFRYARVWGDSVKHSGQKVGENHKLADGDVVSIFA